MGRGSICAAYRLVAAALLAAAAAPAWGQEKDCPNRPNATYTLSIADTEGSRSQIARLAGPAKEKGAVCILAFYDSQDAAHSRLLALKRVDWVRRQLTEAGVPESIISRAMHPGEKSAQQQVQIILGD